MGVAVLDDTPLVAAAAAVEVLDRTPATNPEELSTRAMPGAVPDPGTTGGWASPRRARLARRHGAAPLPSRTSTTPPSARAATLMAEPMNNKGTSTEEHAYSLEGGLEGAGLRRRGPTARLELRPLLVFRRLGLGQADPMLLKESPDDGSASPLTTPRTPLAPPPPLPLPPLEPWSMPPADWRSPTRCGGASRPGAWRRSRPPAAPHNRSCCESCSGSDTKTITNSCRLCQRTTSPHAQTCPL